MHPEQFAASVYCAKFPLKKYVTLVTDVNKICSTPLEGIIILPKNC